MSRTRAYASSAAQPRTPMAGEDELAGGRLTQPATPCGPFGHGMVRLNGLAGKPWLARPRGSRRKSLLGTLTPVW